MLVVDCLRADHLGVYGYSRDTSPAMDALAADGVRFDQAVAQSNWTRASVASLFTGLYLSQHRVPGIGEEDVNPALRDARRQVADLEGMRILGGNALSDEFVTLAEVASQAGYRTAAFINQAQMPPYIGFAQGFDVYEMSESGDRGVLDAYRGWLQADSQADAPRFAYLHLLMLHYPYTPPPRDDLFRETHELFPADAPQAVRVRTLRQLDVRPEHGEELEALYDGQIHRADGFVRRIVEALRDGGLYDDTLVLLTSDHGEAFFEHGMYGHAGTNLHAEVTRIPLLLKLPGSRHAGTVVEEPAQLVDVLPTLMEVASVESPEGLTYELPGRSLLTLVRNEAEEGVPAFSEVSASADLKAMVWDGHKYLFDLGSGSVQAFELDDSLEQNDVSATLPPERLRGARDVLDRWMTRNREFAARYETDRVEMRADELERLRALGYLR